MTVENKFSELIEHMLSCKDL